jgi:penicillin-binding protein 1A
MLGVGGIFWYYGRDLPDIDSIDDYDPKQVTRVYSWEGELIAQWVDEDLMYRTVVPFDSIPELVRDAVLAAEDADFYSHPGLDFPGVLRAIWVNVRSGRMSQGFSTITQQVVKNLLLTPERTIRRKVQEVLLAFRLEDRLSKDEILTLYLNEVYFGGNRYGVEEASRYYFGHPVSETTLPEAALLAGVLPGPAWYNPYRHPEAALARRAYVLRQMWEKGFIEEAAYRTAVDSPLELAENPYPYLGAAPYFTSEVRRLLIAELGQETVLAGGLQIQTTVRLEHQRAADRAVRLALRDYDERHNSYRPLRHLDDGEVMGFRERHEPEGSIAVGDRFEAVVLQVGNDALTVGIGDEEVIIALAPAGRVIAFTETGEPLFEYGDVIAVSARSAVTAEVWSDTPELAAFGFVPGAQGAFVAIDPSDRSVVAIVGGYDYRESEFNRSTQATRQTGSAFKPFIYGAALFYELVTAAAIVRDEPTPYRLPGGRLWNPQNSDGHYLGAIPLRTALARSRNVVSVRLLDELGLDRAQEFAHNVGISSPMTDNLTMALGSSELPVIEIVNAYATLASSGEVHEPRFVSRVTDPAGNEVWSQPYEPEVAIEPPLAFLITDMMTSVVERGTATRARAVGRPAAGKTGTTNEARDAWFIGFVPQLVAGGWIGFDDNSPLGRGEYGGRAALPMWVTYMQTVLEGEPVLDFTVPEEGLVRRRVDPGTGLLAQPDAPDGVLEWFLEGTEPTRFAPEPAGTGGGYDEF